MKDLKRRVKKVLLKTVWSFGPDDVVRAIRKLGVKEGDVVMVHSSWRADSGFRGTVRDLVQAFIGAVGPSGTVCMMSMPFHGMSMAEYLESGKVFDVRRTVAMVGLPSEVFRRRRGVVRSLHPTHSIAAFGPHATEIINGHEHCVAPFDESGPFGKLIKFKYKIILFDVPFNTMTFEHHIEDQIQDSISVPLYEPSIITSFVVDYYGNRIAVNTRVLSREVAMIRQSNNLEVMLRSARGIKYKKLGCICISAVDSAIAMEYVINQSVHGSPFHKKEMGG